MLCVGAGIMCSSRFSERNPAPSELHSARGSVIAGKNSSKLRDESGSSRDSKAVSFMRDKSPNDLYAIQEVERPVPERGYPEHLLFLSSKGKKEPLKILSTGTNSYERFVEVLWSPNSQMFVVNDWFGSDIANAYLYRVDDLAHPVDIAQSIAQSSSNKLDRDSIANGVHIYQFVSKWIDPYTVEIRIVGDYTSKPNYRGRLLGFTVYYLWDVRTNSIKRVKQVPEMRFPAMTSTGK